MFEALWIIAIWLSGMALGFIVGHLVGYREAAEAEKKKPEWIPVPPETVWVTHKSSSFHFDAECSAKTSPLAHQCFPMLFELIIQLFCRFVAPHTQM